MIWEHTASLLQSPTVPLFPVLSSYAAAVQYSRHQTLVLYSGSDRPPESLRPSVLASDRPPKWFHPSVLVSGQPLVPLTSQGLVVLLPILQSCSAHLSSSYPSSRASLPGHPPEWLCPSALSSIHGFQPLLPGFFSSCFLLLDPPAPFLLIE